ncbi:BRISC complex subunit FAM175B-like [Schistocerca cancellata]|uniref:BRISC complex subunit FAM175B-like n=1 Tax=Schistocerca cancellata TaxID=274614 RepID=UPI002118085A|nr:BRISC complex subunit FAM175B-like [Schistocerca cancellata]
MSAQVCVMFSGPALSFLIYENTNSICDQEGFLVGEIINHVRNTISDAQISNQQMETLISVNCLVPLPSTVPFYNSIGKINKQKLKLFIGEMEGDIVGWYTFRRNAALVPHLRDKLLHKQLQTMLPNLSSELFMMGILNTVVSNSGSTHTFNHKFVRYRNRNYEALPVQVLNLGETHSEYTTVPVTAGLSESFGKLIRTVEISDKECDVFVMCRIQKSLQEHLKKISSALKESENRASQLEMEVESLRISNDDLSNELLLPQLLQDGGCKTDQLVPLQVPITPVLLKNDKVDLIADEDTSSKKKQNKSSQGAMEDPFSYVTEMKLEMTPQQTPSGSGGARVSERGRGRGRGTTVRESQKRQTQSRSEISDKQEVSPSLRRRGPSPSLTTTPSGRTMSVPTKQRSYATVARKLSDNNESVAKSPAVSTNGSPSESNTQEQ